MFFSDAFLTEITWQVLIEGYLISLLFVHQLTSGFMIELKSIELDCIKIYKVSVL